MKSKVIVSTFLSTLTIFNYVKSLYLENWNHDGNWNITMYDSKLTNKKASCSLKSPIQFLHYFEELTPAKEQKKELAYFNKHILRFSLTHSFSVFELEKEFKIFLVTADSKLLSIVLKVQKGSEEGKSFISEVKFYSGPEDELKTGPKCEESSRIIISSSLFSSKLFECNLNNFFTIKAILRAKLNPVGQCSITDSLIGKIFLYKNQNQTRNHLGDIFSNYFFTQAQKKLFLLYLKLERKKNLLKRKEGISNLFTTQF